MMLISASGRGEGVTGGMNSPELERSLPSGTPAPYSGVLVPLDSYRFYQEDVFVKNLCEETLRRTQKDCLSERILTGQNAVILILGFMAGFLIGGH